MIPSLLALLVPLTASAGGVLLSPQQSLTGYAEAPEISQVRAVVVEDAGGAVIAMQAQVAADGPRLAWIVPIPGGHQGEPRGIGDTHLEAVLSATDPYYSRTAGCGTGCSASVASGDSGDTGGAGAGNQSEGLLEVRTFGDRYDRGQVSMFPADRLAGMVAELLYEGFVIDDAVQKSLEDYAAQGWSFAALRLSSAATDTNATPLFAVRSASTGLVLPLAVSAASAARVPLEVTVLAIGESRIEPTVLPATQVRLGAPLYTPADTPVFYNARVDVAIEEAGGQAWVIEYAGPLSRLQDRVALLGGLEDPDTTKLLERMAKKGLLDDGAPGTRWVTRWRTFLDGDELVDEVFVPTAGPAYEVTIDASDYLGGTASGWLPFGLLLPLAGLGWGLGRRRG